MYFRNSGRILLVGVLLASWMCVAQASTIAEVSVLKNGKLLQKGIATLVADEVLVVNSSLIELGNQIQVIDNINGATLVGIKRASLDGGGLTLISVKGLGGEPYLLANEALKPGRKIYMVTGTGASKEAVLLQVLLSSDKQPFERVEHTASVKEGEYGAPILNNCKQLAGISLNQRRGLFDAKLEPSLTNSVASRLTTLKDFLNQQNVTYQVANNRCLSEGEILKKLETEKIAQDEELEQAKQEQLAKEDDIKELKDKGKKQAEELAKAEQESKEKATQLEDARKESKLKQEELEQAEKDKQEHAEKLEQAEEERKQAEEDIKKAEQKSQRGEERQRYLAVAIGVVFLLFVIVWWALTRKRSQLSDVEKEAESSVHQLSVEKAKYEAVQEELEKASSTFSDLVFVGKDEDGVEYRIKVSGDMLARSPGGILIGRSAEKAASVIAAQGVSREHLKLSLREERVMVDDLESFNGTAINGKALVAGEDKEVKSGDEVRIGTVTGRIHFLN